MNVDVHEGIEDRLHELVVQGLEIVVGQLDVLQAVQVLEGGRADVVDSSTTQKDRENWSHNTVQIK